MANSVAKRRADKTAEIVASAWALARADGIAGVTLHGLARAVGMRQPSLYVYFDSKLALYDAMFADGNRQLLERMDAVTFSPEPRGALKQWLHAFATFGNGRNFNTANAVGLINDAGSVSFGKSVWAIRLLLQDSTGPPSKQTPDPGS